MCILSSQPHILAERAPCPEATIRGKESNITGKEAGSIILDIVYCSLYNRQDIFSRRYQRDFATSPPTTADMSEKRMRRLPAYTDKTTFRPLPPHTLYTATNITMDDTVDTISRMAFEGELDMNVHYTNKKKIYASPD